MRHGGAGGVRGPGAARAIALLLVALLAFTIVPPMAAPPAAAQAGSDPWWGPSSRDRPTDGWAIRVPVVVENRFDYPIRDSVVSVDVDFGKLLIQAGWTSQLLGTEQRLRGFTLDVDSIRVVEYGAGFASGPIHGPGTEPTPHVFYESPFHAERYRDFDASRNPAGTVLFLLKDTLGINQKRFFYIYANPLEYGKMEPAVFRLQDRAPLDAFLWGSTGTVFYGWEPQQSEKTNRILVLPLTSKKTTVTLYERDFGRFVPSRSTPTSQNPQELGDGGLPFGRFFVPGGKAFKIVASHPVAVVGHGATPPPFADTSETFGFYPSRSGSFAGNQFLAYGFTHAQNGNAAIAIKTGPGTSTVRVIGGAIVTLTTAEPVKAVPLQFQAWNNIVVDGAPILLGMPDIWEGQSPDRPFHQYQVPALTGGPSGIDFYFNVPQDGGFVRLCPEARTGVRIVDHDRPDFMAIPEGPRDSTAPILIGPRPGCHEYEATPTMPQPLEAYAIGAEPRYPVENAPVPYRVIVGAEGREKAPGTERRMVGHYGGLAAVDFHVSGSTGIFGVFNDTRITVIEDLKNGGSANYTFTLSRDQFQAIEDPARNNREKTGRYQILASKPISVVSLEEAHHSYARIVPGLPQNPNVVLGAAEFRGPLVELRSPETDGRQLYRSTGPQTPITFRLEVLNLGRWIAGEGLTDTVSIACRGPAEWDIAGCGREFNVGSGNAERFEVTVTPSADDVNTTSFVEIEARSSTPGIVSKFRLAVYVEIRYGVGLWFDVENGRKTIDPIVGVDPGETHAYSLVLKNTGSTEDTFSLKVDDPKEGWTQALLLDGEPVREVRLRGGESRVLSFRVTAPAQETAPQNLVSVTAESQSSDLASAKDIVNTATRIRPKININLEVAPPTRVAEPNESARFNVTVTNRGNDVFTIAIVQDSVLPEGWSTELGLPGGEVSLNPNDNYTFPFLVTPPLGSRAGDLVTVKLSAQTDTGGGGAVIPGDEVSAVVVVKRIHNITTPPLLDARAEPGDTIRYVLPLVNHGNGDDAIELLPGADTDWSIRADGQPLLVLGLDEQGDFPLQIDVPRGAPPGLHNLSVTLRLSREATQVITVPVDVRPVAKLTMAGVARIEAAPARATVVELDVENVGNLPANFTFLADTLGGWNVTFEPPVANLRPADKAKVLARVNASRDIEDGNFTITLGATAGPDGPRAGDKPVDVRVGRPTLVITGVETTGDLSPGEVILVKATIQNQGGIAAEDVRVALLVDGEQVDQVTLSRIPVGQSQAATLNWLATRRGVDVRVVIDPEQQMVLETRDKTDASVTFGRTLGLPGPELGLVLATLGAAAALAAAGRRRRA